MHKCRLYLDRLVDQVRTGSHYKHRSAVTCCNLARHRTIAVVRATDFSENADEAVRGIAEAFLVLASLPKATVGTNLLTFGFLSKGPPVRCPPRWCSRASARMDKGYQKPRLPRSNRGIKTHELFQAISAPVLGELLSKVVSNPLIKSYQYRNILTFHLSSFAMGAICVHCHSSLEMPHHSNTLLNLSFI
jgi:hypothetical protein